jgi:hypothetical protein
MNEPGFEIQPHSAQFDIYSRMVFHANIETAFLNMINSPPSFARHFYDEMAASFHANKQGLINRAVELSEYDEKREYMDFFRMGICYKFSTLADKIRETIPRNPFISAAATAAAAASSTT